MKPVLFTLAALMLYASQNVLIEQKLARFSTVTMLIAAYLVMLPLALAWLGYLRLAGQPVVAPLGSALPIMVGLAILWFAADACYLAAYTSGGSLMTVTTLMLLFPVAAAAMRYWWVGGLPTRYHLAGYVFAALAVLLVAKGQSITPPR